MYSAVQSHTTLLGNLADSIYPEGIVSTVPVVFPIVFLLYCIITIYRFFTGKKQVASSGFTGLTQ